MHNNLYNNTGDQGSDPRTDQFHYADRLELQLQSIDSAMDTKSSPLNSNATEATENETSHDWISAFNTSLLTTRANHAKDRSLELGELMQTPEFASLLIGAQHLAANQGLSKEEATERLIEVFRRIDFAWKQIVIKRGLQSIIE
jgi:hypothetical protein